MDAKAIDGDVIDDITHRIDMSICRVRPKLTPWAEQFLCNAQEKRFAVCMISNTGWISSTAIKKIFVQENLANHFVGWFFSGDGYRPKPNPEMFRAALADLNADIAQVIHIGDQARTDGMGARGWYNQLFSQGGVMSRMTCNFPLFLEVRSEQLRCMKRGTRS